MLIVSSRGYKILIPIIVFINKFYKRHTFDFVIGGARYKIYDKNKLIKKMAYKFNRIFVETANMKEEYKKRGLNNVDVIPNFKNILPININDIKKDTNKKNLKICTFTRIHKDKGIEDSINAVKIANKMLNSDIFQLDIYGEIDKKYGFQFEEQKKQFPQFISHKGCINAKDAVNVLKKYDLMLFLTYWKGEGFPGTIIDAFFSGLPVIATEWNYNFEVLKENITGYKVKVKNPEEVARILIKLYKEQEKLVNMKFECLKEADEYTPSKAMKKFIEQIA